MRHTQFLPRMPILSHRPVPHTVSYTHLHIMLFIALIGALPIFLLRNELGGWFSDSPAVSVMVAQLIIPFIIYPVSYTHLDVYKRQLLCF